MNLLLVIIYIVSQASPKKRCEEKFHETTGRFVHNSVLGINLRSYGTTVVHQLKLKRDSKR
jgi:hypothetical protein